MYLYGFFFLNLMIRYIFFQEQWSKVVKCFDEFDYLIVIKISKVEFFFSLVLVD